jgi:hypothetical protein
MCKKIFSIGAIFSKSVFIVGILIATETIKADTTEVSNTDQEPSKQSRFGFRRLSLELFGQYTFQPQSTNGTQSESSLGGNGQTQLNFVLPAMNGPGIGGRLEAEFFPKFSFVLGAQYKALGAKYKAYSSTALGSSTTLIYANSNEEFYYKTWMLDLGFRVKTLLLSGEIYAGAGAGIIMPFQSNNVAVYDYSTGYGTNVSSLNSLKTVKNYNLGIAGVVELGYQYPLSSRVSMGISLAIIFGSVSNANQSGETTAYYGDGSTTKITREYRKAFSIDEAAAFNSANNGNSSLAIYESLNITDVGIRGMVSFRMF